MFILVGHAGTSSIGGAKELGKMTTKMTTTRKVHFLEPLAGKIQQLWLHVNAILSCFLGMCAGDIDSTLLMCIDDI